MASTLLKSTLPRTLHSWVDRFTAPPWQGSSLAGWLFEGARARRAAERRLRAAGVQARLRSAYKPLLHFFLEEVDRRRLAAATIHYPVHPLAAPGRFLSESYPLAALLPGCRLDFVPGSSDLHYRVALTMKDGSHHNAAVFAPNRIHAGSTGDTLLSPTGWLRVTRPSAASAQLDQAETTDYEMVLQQVIDAVERHPWPAHEPFFERLDIQVELPGIVRPLPVGHECMDTHEALHEDIYFSLLEIFHRRSGREAGDRRLQPGQIVPDVRAGTGAPRLRMALAKFKPAVVTSAHREDPLAAKPLERLEAPVEPDRIRREMDALQGERFTATSRQGRSVAGLYQRKPGPAVLISGGQHANEISGVVGALRAGWALQAQGAHFALLPLENPDGYALQRELSARHPRHMLHAARYSALGDDIEYRDRTPWYERAARDHALALSGAHLHVNLHGYPAHEWTRPLSGYLPRGFELWTIPKGFFLILRHHCGWQAEGRALLERVAAELAAWPGLAEFNARQMALYQRHAGPLPFEVIAGTACAISETIRPGAPVTLITEFPDETITGEAFRFAHTVQTAAALAAVRAWQSQARA